ncbi:MAG TPA: hypothetical protein VFS64_04560 [Solirubrobacterales bacterium]|nr:hypothetical protein [Solirubrobacterales bacterium]
MIGRLLKRRPRPAFVLACIALVLSLAGTTYAGVQIGRNSVGTFQLRNGAVTAAKLRDGAVTGAKLRCPSASVLIGTGCIEEGLRGPAGYGQAVASCAASGGRLPLIAELNAMGSLGKPLGNPELVADISVNGSQFPQTLLYSEGRVAVTETIDTPRRFRCVTSPG